MAQARVIDSRLARVWRGIPNGGGPDTFLVCALVTKGLNQTKNTNTAIIPDCDDPTVVAPVKRTPMSIDAVISGDGYYEPPARGALQDAFDDDTSLIWSFELPDPEANSGGYYSGKFFLTALNTTADEGQYVRAAMTWEADGAVTWTHVDTTP